MISNNNENDNNINDNDNDKCNNEMIILIMWDNGNDN